jgi:hypothetical protein
MTHKISLRNVARDDHKFVISTCGFTFQGYALPQKVRHRRFAYHFEEMMSQQDRENILNNQHAHIVVFLG